MQRRVPPLELPFDPRSRGPEVAPSRRPEELVVSVGELDRRLKRLVEGGTGDVRVAGEITGLREVSSGHAYFTLKDEREEASIDCVMYRTAAPRSRRLLADGARVVLHGRVTLYAPRGKLQLVADEARPLGRGALLEALERLKEKLAAEGLFAPERKRPMPTDARVIGVVTSSDGAAIHDIVTVAFRRGGVRLVLARTPVQGPAAPARIARAIAMLARLPEIEVIVLARGGGSSDDLAAYNDERLARSIAACAVPILSAIGHEIDMTLADLVADARAATPSEAAERLVADGSARALSLGHLEARLRRAIRQRIRDQRTALDRFRARLARPALVVSDRRLRLDDVDGRLRAQFARRLLREQSALARLERRLAERHPRAVVAASRAAIAAASASMRAAMIEKLGRARGELVAGAARLDALSPLSVLARGYAIATDERGNAIRAATDVRAGELIALRLHSGGLVARVVESPGDRGEGAGDDG